jgi:hypothetical protein
MDTIYFRFVLAKCDRTLIVEGKKTEETVAELKSAGFNPDPVKRWKASQVTIDFDFHFVVESMPHILPN